MELYIPEGECSAEQLMQFAELAQASGNTSMQVGTEGYYDEFNNYIITAYIIEASKP